MKNTFFLLVGLVVISVSVYFFLQSPVPSNSVLVEEPVVSVVETEGIEAVLQIGESFINIEVADTPEKRQQGLSGRMGMEQGTGLLFVFDQVGKHGIWMKDMNFSIDIVWLDEDMRVVLIEESVSPDTYPRVFSSSEPSLYVLELPAGSVNEYNAQIGDLFNFKT